MNTTVPNRKELLARLVVLIIVAYLALGVVTYGFSAETRQRVWDDLLARPSAIMSFRFLLQPAMAVLAAVRDGLADARTERSPHFWTVLTDRAERAGRLWEGILSTAQIVFLGLCMDTVYQVIEFRSLYPAEAVIVAIALGFVPYLLLRGPIARLARLARA